MIYTAQQLRNYWEAGLEVWGQDEDGELEWLGTEAEWAAWERIDNGEDINPFI